MRFMKALNRPPKWAQNAVINEAPKRLNIAAEVQLTVNDDQTQQLFNSTSRSIECFSIVLPFLNLCATPPVGAGGTAGGL